VQPGWILALWACTCCAGIAGAQGKVSIEKVSFKVTEAFEPGAEVVGELRVPDSKRGRLPALLIVDSSPGFDGRGAFYAESLNEGGIATLEIDMMQGKGMPASPRHHLPHAYESLQYLARHPRIDATRIGIMGFSWGGMVALLTSSEELTRQYTVGSLRFAAHLGLYPICWRHGAVIAGEDKYFNPSVYEWVTGAPVHILAAEKDDYDEPDSCGKFLAALPPQARAHFSLTVYPGATFGWDSRFGSASYMAGAKKGKGGIAHVVANADLASQSREFAVGYFRKNLAAE
jgi:dienelactone hydrolase